MSAVPSVARSVESARGNACEVCGLARIFPVWGSVVMPCLNEPDTVAPCIGKARQAFKQAGLAGEIIVADNGSTDGSREIARRLE